MKRQNKNLVNKLAIWLAKNGGETKVSRPDIDYMRKTSVELASKGRVKEKIDYLDLVYSDENVKGAAKLSGEVKQFRDICSFVVGVLTPYSEVVDEENEGEEEEEDDVGASEPSSTQTPTQKLENIYANLDMMLNFHDDLMRKCIFSYPYCKKIIAEAVEPVAAEAVRLLEGESVRDSQLLSKLRLQVRKLAAKKLSPVKADSLGELKESLDEKVDPDLPEDDVDDGLAELGQLQEDCARVVLDLAQRFSVSEEVAGVLSGLYKTTNLMIDEILERGNLEVNLNKVYDLAKRAEEESRKIIAAKQNRQLQRSRTYLEKLKQMRRQNNTNSDDLSVFNALPMAKTLQIYEMGLLGTQRVNLDLDSADPNDIYANQDKINDLEDHISWIEDRHPESSEVAKIAANLEAVQDPSAVANDVKEFSELMANTVRLKDGGSDYSREFISSGRWFELYNDIFRLFAKEATNSNPSHELSAIRGHCIAAVRKFTDFKRKCSRINNRPNLGKAAKKFYPKFLDSLEHIAAAQMIKVEDQFSTMDDPGDRTKAVSKLAEIMESVADLRQRNPNITEESTEDRFYESVQGFAQALRHNPSMTISTAPSLVIPAGEENTNIEVTRQNCELFKQAIAILNPEPEISVEEEDGELEEEEEEEEQQQQPVHHLLFDIPKPNENVLLRETGLEAEEPEDGLVSKNLFFNKPRPEKKKTQRKRKRSNVKFDSQTLRGTLAGFKNHIDRAWVRQQKTQVLRDSALREKQEEEDGENNDATKMCVFKGFDDLDLDGNTLRFIGLQRGGVKASDGPVPGSSEAYVPPSKKKKKRDKKRDKKKTRRVRKRLTSDDDETSRRRTIFRRRKGKRKVQKSNRRRSFGGGEVVADELSEHENGAKERLISQVESVDSEFSEEQIHEVKLPMDERGRVDVEISENTRQICIPLGNDRYVRVNIVASDGSSDDLVIDESDQEIGTVTHELGVRGNLQFRKTDDSTVTIGVRYPSNYQAPPPQRQTNVFADSPSDHSGNGGGFEEPVIPSGGQYDQTLTIDNNGIVMGEIESETKRLKLEHEEGTKSWIINIERKDDAHDLEALQLPWEGSTRSISYELKPTDDTIFIVEFTGQRQRRSQQGDNFGYGTLDSGESSSSGSESDSGGSDDNRSGGGSSGSKLPAHRENLPLSVIGIPCAINIVVGMIAAALCLPISTIAGFVVALPITAAVTGAMCLILPNSLGYSALFIGLAGCLVSFVSAFGITFSISGAVSGGGCCCVGESILAIPGCFGCVICNFRTVGMMCKQGLEGAVQFSKKRNSTNRERQPLFGGGGNDRYGSGPFHASANTAADLLEKYTYNCIAKTTTYCLIPPILAATLFLCSDCNPSQLRFSECFGLGKNEVEGLRERMDSYNRGEKIRDFGEAVREEFARAYDEAYGRSLPENLANVVTRIFANTEEFQERYDAAKQAVQEARSKMSSSEIKREDELLREHLNSKSEESGAELSEDALNCFRAQVLLVETVLQEVVVNASNDTDKLRLDHESIALKVTKDCDADLVETESPIEATEAEEELGPEELTGGWCGIGNCFRFFQDVVSDVVTEVGDAVKDAVKNIKME